MSPRILSLLLCLTLPATAAAQTPGSAPRYIDDDKHAEALEKAVLKLAEDGKATRGKELLNQLNRKSCGIAPAPPSAPILEPEEIYTGCNGGVAAISSAWKSDDGDGWQAGEPATAWILTPDGVMVTNYHIFLEAEKEEVFGVMLSDGRFFPVTEILAADSLNDVAIFKIPAKGLQPLALGVNEPVGKKVCVISHPDRQFYTFTQGQISRYTLQRDEEKAPPVKYMCITADYARGSSGGPVLNEHGAVVGMVCSTRTTYYGEKDKDKDDDVQMVVKFCIPGESIRALLKASPVTPVPSEKEIPPRAIPVEATPPVIPVGSGEAPPKATPVPEQPQ